MTVYAGLYGPEALIDDNGRPITSATIDVFTHGTTTHVSLYQDNARATPLSNPVPGGVDGSTAGRGLDTHGNVSFYVDPGRYDLRIATGAGTRTIQIEVGPDPAEGNAAYLTPPITSVETLGHSYAENNFDMASTGPAVPGKYARYGSLLAAGIHAWPDRNYALGGAQVGVDDTSGNLGGWVRALQQMGKRRTRTAAPYRPATDVATICYGINDLRIDGTHNVINNITQAVQAIIEPTRAIISRARASAIFEAEGSTAWITFPSGTWTINSNAGKTNSGTGNRTLPTGTAGSIQWVIPADVPAGSWFAVGFCVLIGQTGTVTITQNGSAAATLVLDNVPGEQASKYNGAVRRIQVNPGDVIVASTSATVNPTTGGPLVYDYAQIEASKPPLVVLLEQPQLDPNCTYITGSAVTNANIITMNVALRTLAAEFDRCITVPLDAVLGYTGTVGSGTADTSYFRTDLLHPNERGHAAIAVEVQRQIMMTLNATHPTSVAAPPVTSSRGSNGQKGVVGPTAGGWSYNARSQTANRAWFVRVRVDEPLLVTSLAFGVTTAASTDDPCDVGIYDSGLNLLVSAGATTGKLNSTGAKTVPLVYTLQPDTTYYFAFAYGAAGGTLAVLLAASFADASAVQLFGATAGLVEGGFMDTAYPLPAALTINLGSTLVPVLAARES